MAKDTAPSALVAWFNRHVASYLHEQDAFDDEGVFLVDGSYLFVPDNPNYEGSSVLRFDGHWGSATVPIHVVLIRERKSDGSLNEWNLATTNEHATATEVRNLYEKRTAIEERHRQLKCFWDLPAFRSRAFSLVTAQVVFVLLAYTLLQVFMAKLSRGELNTKTRERLIGEFAYENDMVVLYSRNRVAYLTPLQNQEVLLSLPEDARRRVLAKTRKLREQSLLGTDKPRRPGF